MKVSASKVLLFQTRYIFIKYSILLFLLSILIVHFMSAQVPKVIIVEEGWNLLSLPVKVADGRRSILFPTAASNAFIYDGSYIVRDTLENGYGFWIKYDSPLSFLVIGAAVGKDTVEVQTGWNIIGSLTMPVIVDSIRSIPQGIIISEFFSYVPGIGYQERDTLQPGTGYWVKIRSAGSIVLSSDSVGSTGWPCPDAPTVEYAGKTYNTVQIGSQCWLKENLDVGKAIYGNILQSNNGIIEKYCYNNDTINCNIYGGLYIWDEVMQYTTAEGAQGICPSGWHVPTHGEFLELEATVADDGNALKDTSQGTGLYKGTNTTGFSALFGGYRSINGTFNAFGVSGRSYFWSSTEYEDTNAYYLSLEYNSTAVVINDWDKNYGLSVRCVKGAANLSPEQPYNPSPTDSSVGVDSSVTISWMCTDPEDDPLSYNVYFGTDNPPVTIISTNQVDTFYSLSDLNPTTTYYWKVVAKDNHFNNKSGPVWKFTTGYAGGGIPCPGLSSVEYQGKTYNTVQIGSQCWLKENLDVGTMILGSVDQNNNSMIEKYCYDNNIANCTVYGGLYQWDEAVQYYSHEGAQGICPSGWHIPMYAELETLYTTAGGDGNSLKAIGQGTGAGTGTNTSGFSALLAGWRILSGSYFEDLYYGALFWSSTDNGYLVAAKFMKLNYDNSITLLGEAIHEVGLSVRCIKD